jgi:hypothetical protein
MPTWRLVICLLLLLAQPRHSLRAGPVFTTAGGGGVADDVFDIASGAQVILSSPQHNSCCGNSDPRSILGFSESGGFVEQGTAIFADGAAAGTVDYLEFQTAAPVNLGAISLRLSQDGATAYRGATAFRLLASQDGMSFFQISGGSVPGGARGNLNVPLLITDTALAGNPTNVRSFRLEVTRATEGGVRVVELDGVGTAGVSTGVFLDRLAFNASGNRLTGRGSAALDDEGPGLASDFRVSSRLDNADTPEDAFGRNHGALEPDNFVFADGGVPDNGNLVMGDEGETVDFIEWRTTVAFPLAGYQLSVRGDGSSTNRGSGLVRFLVNGSERDRFHCRGAAGAIPRIFTDGVVEGDRFRIELTRVSSLGPGVMEIDAITGPLPPLNAGLRINEIVSRNGESRVDEDGDSPDWIELFNAGEERLNLAGWGLTDRPAIPLKWVFPSVSLPPRGYLLVFASGKNRSVAGLPLHANFQLEADGETVILNRPDGTTVDSVPAVRLRRDVSFGRQPDGVGDWKYFRDPSPLGPNLRTAYESIVFETPVFTAPAGFHSNAVLLSASIDESEVALHYTLDGSEPTEASPQLDRPLAITTRAGQSNVLSMVRRTATANQHTDGWKPPQGEVRKATVVRVRGLRPHAVPGPIATHTYFVGADAVRTDNLPVLSITSPTNGLFDYQQGIYMLGAIFDQYVAAHPGETLTGHTPANYTQRGAAWERAAHVEFFEPGGRFAFEASAGLDIQGQSSRSFRQKSFGLKARGESGNGFEYPFFAGLTRLGDSTPLASFRHLRLRNAGNDWDYAMMRDDWCHRLADGLGLDLMSSRPVTIYLDGEYWGILCLREQQDPQYVTAHYGVPDNEVVILYGDGALEEGRPGDDRPFRDLRAYAETHDLGSGGNFEYVRRRLDLENFATYQIAEIYFGNADWPQNNMRVWRRRLPSPDPSLPQGQDGRWRWFLFDVDLGASHPWSGGVTENTLAVALSPTGRSGFNTPWATAFLRALLANPGFKNDFLNTSADLLNSHFSARRAVALVDSMEAELLPGMAEHIRRWQSNGGTLSAWRDRVRVIRTFAQQRTAVVRAHFVSAFKLGGTALVRVDVSNPAGGTVRVNRLKIDGDLPGVDPLAPYPWTGTYFKGLTIALEANPFPGFRFTRWSGVPDSPGHPSITIPLSTNLNVMAEFDPIPPEIAGVSWVTPNSMHLGVRGIPGESYTLQSSEDLLTWSDQVTVTTAADGAGLFRVDFDATRLKRFFRIRWR